MTDPSYHLCAMLFICQKWPASAITQSSKNVRLLGNVQTQAKQAAAAASASASAATAALVPNSRKAEVNYLRDTRIPE